MFRYERYIQTQPLPDQPPIRDIQLPQLQSFSNRNQVLHSLATFAHGINAIEEINVIAEQHQTKDKPEPTQFVLSHPLQRLDVGSYRARTFDDFVLDSEFSLALGAKRPWKKPVWLAVTSFDGLEQEHEMKEPGIALIKQLQSREPKSFDSKDKALLDGYRWEFILVNLVSLWAERSGLSGVEILPSNKNKWNETVNFRGGSLYTRYDVTAKRLGFKKHESSGNYRLSFETS